MVNIQCFDWRATRHLTMFMVSIELHLLGRAFYRDRDESSGISERGSGFGWSTDISFIISIPYHELDEAG